MADIGWRRRRHREHLSWLQRFSTGGWEPARRTDSPGAGWISFHKPHLIEVRTISFPSATRALEELISIGKTDLGNLILHFQKYYFVIHLSFFFFLVVGMVEWKWLSLLHSAQNQKIWTMSWNLFKVSTYRYNLVWSRYCPLECSKHLWNKILFYRNIPIIARAA